MYINVDTRTEIRKTVNAKYHGGKIFSIYYTIVDPVVNIFLRNFLLKINQ